MTSLAATISANATTTAEFEQSYATAEESRKLAASVGGEWRDVEKLLKSARAAAQAGELDKAMDLTQTALHQSQLGYRQALDQKTNYSVPAQLQ